jgi:urea transport system ATP-binding protein
MIFPLLTVRENLETGLRLPAEGERTHSRSHLRAVPGPQGDADRRGGDLSGGQQQQLAIARALIARPKRPADG